VNLKKTIFARLPPQASAARCGPDPPRYASGKGSTAGRHIQHAGERQGGDSHVERGLMLEAGRRDVAEVRVAEAVASGEVVCVGPRATADGRVDSAQQCARLARLVTRPVDCRQLTHYSSVHARTAQSVRKCLSDISEC